MDSYGAALQYFTGSKEHNIELRRLALQKGLKLNEYGVFKKDTDEKVAGRTEEEVYSSLGLSYVPPELRENRGEIEAAARNTLPDLVHLRDIKGDLHIHTPMSDGKDSMESLIDACQKKGYQYIGFTDHSQSLKIANGLSEERLLESIKEVREISNRIEGIKVFRGAEVDILEDGSLDYPNSVLKELDYVIGSVHSRFKMARREMTERIIKAMSNDYLTILGHPTGRLLGQREAYELEMDLVMNAAKEYGVCMELNAAPNRLDLNDANCIKAKARGIMLCVNTDAHYIAELDNMCYGIETARRGWLEAPNVLNSRTLGDLQRQLPKAPL